MKFIKVNTTYWDNVNKLSKTHDSPTYISVDKIIEIVPQVGLDSYQIVLSSQCLSCISTEITKYLKEQTYYGDENER